MELLFPSSYKKHKYGHIHFSFIIHTAKLANISVKIIQPNDTVWIGTLDQNTPQPIISCVLDNQQILLDYLDHPHRDISDMFPYVPYFKMQYDPDINTSKNVFPMGPIYGLAWENEGMDQLQSYYNLRRKQTYTGTSDIISNRQKVHGDEQARKRRGRVQHMLIDNFGDRVDTASNVPGNYGLSAKDYWKSITNSMVTVCIPGATPNSLDRNQIEAMGLGACTISPKINIRLAGCGQLVPNVHHIMCKNDFSDLPEKVIWCEDNRQECVKIGNNAKQLFTDHCMPHHIWKWIRSKI